MWWWRDSLTGPDGRRVDVGFTDTGDGVSTGPVASLNLGGAVGDDPANVARNRAAVAASVGVAPDDLVFMHQTHSDRVLALESDGTRDLDGDGVVTRSRASLSRCSSPIAPRCCSPTPPPVSWPPCTPAGPA